MVGYIYSFIDDDKSKFDKQIDNRLYNRQIQLVTWRKLNDFS